MLVLTRKQNQKVIIANEIVIQVIGIGRDSIKLGIDAPDHIEVNREEVQERIAEGSIGAKPQIPSEDTLEALSRVDNLAKARGMQTTELLNELVRRFVDGAQSSD